MTNSGEARRGDPVYLRIMILGRASRVTARRLGLGSKESPLAGLCAPVALMVQVVAGGDILQGEVSGQPHFWNRLLSGEEIDLTGDQFGGNGVDPVTEGAVVPKHPLVPLPHLLFAEAVLNTLQG